jgi:hypothetical protein
MLRKIHRRPRKPPQYDERSLCGGDLEFIMEQVARLPTRSDLARIALGIIFSTAVVTTSLN